MAQFEQHLAKGDFQAALQLIDAELSSAPSADRWLMAFNVRARLEDFDGALRALLGRRTQGPWNADTHPRSPRPLHRYERLG